jgi:uncharacterized protein DUF4145
MTILAIRCITRDSLWPVKFENIRQEANRIEAARIKMRCPVCLREGTLDQRGVDLQLAQRNKGWSNNQPATGERICPNPDCAALIYLVYTPNKAEVIASYPPERLDFDASALPPAVQAPLEEAIDCHAGECYPAAAVMVRRTLEAVCEDQDASGEDLYKRIENLGKKIVLPKGMIKALHNLRLLGNDAVHVEARVYAEVGKREVEVAVDVAKTILQATYQMDAILDELEGLKVSAMESKAAQ